jgi:hypothetical protein
MEVETMLMRTKPFRQRDRRVHTVAARVRQALSV